MSRYIPTKFAPKLYADWYLLIKKLSLTKQAEVIRAIFEYPNFIPEGVDCWDFLSSRLSDQYEMFIKNRESRTDAAKKGAAVRWGDKVPVLPKKESIGIQFTELTDDVDLLTALKNPESGLSIFLATGEGYESSLSKQECEFVDKNAVRERCPWYKKINLQKPNKIKNDYNEQFERFWAAFPGQRKCDKQKSAVKFRVIADGGIDPELLIRKAEQYANSNEVVIKKMAAMPMTWLNQGRWELDYSKNIQEKKIEVPL